VALASATLGPSLPCKVVCPAVYHQIWGRGRTVRQATEYIRIDQHGFYASVSRGEHDHLRLGGTINPV
jgi:hypothetical protein